MTDQTAAAPVSGPQGIGGWLILPLIGLVGTLGFTIYNLFGLFTEIPPAQLIDFLMSDEPSFAPLRNAIWASLAGGIAVIVTAISALILMLTRKRGLPAAMYIHYIVLLAAAAAEYYAAGILEDHGDPSLKQDAIKGLGRAAVAALIWIPYFAKSVRVKNTFIR